jgi:hypothetical protein
MKARKLRKLLDNTDYTIQQDGLPFDSFEAWFRDYPAGGMALIHFTDFRY